METRVHIIHPPIADQSVNPMIAGTETSQLHFLSILNLLRIAIAPFHGHVRVCICVYQHIEGAVAGVQLRKKCYRGGDLAEDRLNL